VVYLVVVARSIHVFASKYSADAMINFHLSVTLVHSPVYYLVND
jgi:hypothetical protein